MKEGKLPRGRAIAYACGGYVAGILLFSFIKPLPETESVFCMAGIAAAGLLGRLSRRRWLQVLLPVLLGASLAMWRYRLSEADIHEGDLSFYNGETVSFAATVIKEPVFKGDGWQLTLKAAGELEIQSRRPADAHSRPENSRPVSGRVLVSLPPFPEYSYGDRLRVSCRLEKPQNKDFAYDRYLARYGIYSLCSRPHAALEAGAQGNAVYAALLAVKRKSYALAEAYMPEPTASLALPVVFGGGQGIEEDITESFRRTGLTHIMAVSGFNVSLLAALLGLGFASLGLARRSVLYLTAAVIAGYVAMVGAPASAVRAGVMSIFLLLALTAERLVSLPRSVLLVAVMTLLVNPRLLRDDIGWQLSFLALLGLMYILPWLERLGLLLTRGRGKALVTALMATVAAQLATAPVILYNFGNFSVIAPLANLLVVWVVPILTVSMMAALALAALLPGWGSIFFFPCWVMVKYIFWVVETLSRLPWAALVIDA